MTIISCLDRQFPQIQAIIFDKDGTLEDSGAYLRNLAQKRADAIDLIIPGLGEPVLKAFGVHHNILDPAGLQAVGSRAENQIVAAGYIAATGKSWMSAIDLARQAFVTADDLFHSTPAAMFPGCLEKIQTLASAGIKLGIISAATTSQVSRFAEYHQLNSYFQVLLGSDLDFAKPDPRLFQYACDKLGVNSDRTLMIGDGAGDMMMGSRGGAAGCIGISWDGISSQLPGADLMITDLSQLGIAESSDC
jgi:phosphoglycolate phosphatase